MAVEVDVQLGKQGRIVIPSNVRRKYELKDGDWLKVVLVLEQENIPRENMA